MQEEDIQENPGLDQQRQEQAGNIVPPPPIQEAPSGFGEKLNKKTIMVVAGTILGLLVVFWIISSIGGGGGIGAPNVRFGTPEFDELTAGEEIKFYAARNCQKVGDEFFSARMQLDCKVYKAIKNNEKVTPWDSEDNFHSLYAIFMGDEQYCGPDVSCIALIRGDPSYCENVSRPGGIDSCKEMVERGTDEHTNLYEILTPKKK